MKTSTSRSLTPSDRARLRAAMVPLVEDKDISPEVFAKVCEVQLRVAEFLAARLAAAEARVEAVEEAMREALDCCARSGACGEVLRAGLAGREETQ